MKMQFKLKSTNTEETTIRLVGYYNYKRIMWSTGVRVRPQLWDHENAKPIVERKLLKKLAPNDIYVDIKQKGISAQLQSMRYDFERKIEEYKANNKKPDFEAIKLELNEKYKDNFSIPTKIESETLGQFVDRFIHEIESGVRLNPTKKTKYNPSTVKVYKEWRTQLVHYDVYSRLNTD